MLHHDPGGRIALVRQGAFALIGKTTQDRVHECRGSGVTIPSGQLYRLVDDRAGRDSL